jgi:REP element-mobilizing transposase RayT
MGSQYRTRGYGPGELVHITVRGHRKRAIFREDGDHDEFMRGFHKFNEALPPNHRLTLHAVGHMSNHQHLLTRNGDSPWAITQVMHRLCTNYAREFNWRNGTAGPVFQRPFRGKVITTGEHIANTFVYIHLNPDGSLRIKDSSHGVFMGLRDDPRIDISLAWKIFGGRAGYTDYFNDTARLRAARAEAANRFNK